MKKVLSFILFISIFFALFLYGCCSSSNDAFVIVSHDSETVYREVVIDEKGRMPRVSFPTGTIIEAPEEMTLQPGIKVTLSEQKFTTGNSSVFSDSSKAVIYIYKVTAVMESNDPLVSDTKVTTVEKPFSVIIPSDKDLTGISFVGVKEDNTSPWRYFQIPGENNNSFNEKSTRNAKDIPLMEYKFSQFRLRSKFALSTYNNSTFDKLPETIVSSLTASTPASILVKNGKYLEDLEINGIMTGSNLDSFNPSDFYARITYRNNSEEVAKIKANGELCKQTTASDKTVPGKSYVHSFTLSNITEASLMSSEGRFAFKLNIKDIDTELFPSSFLIEFYNKNVNEKIYPYIYTEFIDIKKSENVSLAILSDSRNIIDNSNQIYRCNPSFSITSDYDFSESDWVKIASAVRVIKQKPVVSANARLVIASSAEKLELSGVASRTANNSLLLSARTSKNANYEYITEGVTKVYQNNKLLIDFNKNLDSDSNYTITMEEPDNIDGVSIVPFDELSFRTAEDVVFTITPSADSIIDSTNQTLSLDPIFYISANNNYFTDSDWLKVANAISVTNLNENIASKTVNQGVITLFFTQSLENDKQYTISMGEIKSIEGLNIVPLASYTFTTQNVITRNITINIVSDESNIFDKENSIYRVNPIFTIDTGYENFSDEEKELIANSINVSNVDLDSVTKNWDKGKLTIGFNKNLAAGNSYTISMDDIDGLKGIDIDFEPLSFTTLATLTFTLVPDDGNVFVTTPTELYICQPNFTITPSFALNESDRNAIANAVTIDNFADNKLTKSWEDNKLKIGFSSNLSYNATYTLSMNDIEGLDGIIYVPCASFTFTTKDGFNIVMASDDGDVFVTENGNDLYQTLPTFTATTNMPLSAEDKNKITNSITVSNIDPAKVSLVWNDDYTLVLSFTENLATGTDYTISMADIDEIEGVPIASSTLFSFKTMKSLSFTVSPDEDNIYAAMTPKYNCRPGFTITPNYTLDDDNKTTIENAITVSNADGVIKTWDGNNLKIAFDSNLAPDSAHSLAMAEVNSITGVNVTPFAQIDFTTIATLTFVVTPDASNVFISTPTELYHCRPGFTIIPSITLNASDATLIANAVGIDNNASGNMTKIWNNNNLEIGFTSDLNSNTNYNISMAAVDSLKGVVVTPFDNIAFTTMGELDLSVVSSNDSNIFITEDGIDLYHGLPTFTLTTNMPMSDANKAVIASAIAVSNMNSSNINTNWTDDTTLAIGFNSKLASDTNYTISLSSIDDLNGVPIASSTLFSFKTMKNLTLTVTPDEGSIYAAMSPKFTHRPNFTVTPNYTLSAANKAIIQSAVSVSNTNSATKNWDGNNLKIGFSSYLASGSSYIISMSEINSITGVTVEFTQYDFTTIPTLTFTVTPDEDNIYAAMSPKYHRKPAFTITPGFLINDEDKPQIENVISVKKNGSPINITAKEWNGNNLRITFTNYLDVNSTYVLSMGSMTGMARVNVTGFSDQTFTTLPSLTLSIIPDNDNVFLYSNYHCRPGFTIRPSFTINDSDKATISDAVTINNVDESIINKEWEGNDLILNFTQNIATSTTYNLLIPTIYDIKGIICSTNNLNFTTIPDIVVSIATSTSSIVKKKYGGTLSINGKNFLYCQTPEYEVSANYANNILKTKIKDAITLIGPDSNLVTESDWNNNKFTISFSDTLPASSTNRIQVSDITDIKGVTVKMFSSFDFTTFFHQGKGTEADPFTIYTPAQLASIDKYPGEMYCFKQMEDLNLSGYENWEPIGSNINSDLFFNGKYIGNNKKISNLVINRPNESCVGLFAIVSSNSISDLILENFDVTGKEWVGGLSGSMSKFNVSNIGISNFKVSGTRAGALTGYFSNNNLTYSITDVNCASATVSGKDYVGGLIGVSSFGTISDVTCEYIRVTGETGLGGVVGAANNSNYSNVNCSNVVVSGTKDEAGGFAGSSSGCNITDCHCDHITVSGSQDNVGGFAGKSGGSTSCLTKNCSVTNSYVGNNTAQRCGGFFGSLSNSAQNCIASSTEITSQYMCGGFAGHGSFGEGSSAVISNCSVIDSVINCGKKEVYNKFEARCGGFWGYNSGELGDKLTITDCNVKNTTISAEGKYTGGFAGNVCFTTERCYVKDSSVSIGNDSIGGFIGNLRGGNVSKCFVKNTDIEGNVNNIAGFTGEVSSTLAVIDSCYITGCEISSAQALADDNYSLSGFIASNTGTITNCYVYGSTVTGKSDYGALVGVNGNTTTLSDCFVSQDHDTIVGNPGTNCTITSCHYNVNDINTFKDSITWSDGNTINGGSTAWSNYDMTLFPPQISGFPEP